MPQQVDLGVTGVKTKKKINFNSKFDNGSFPVELFLPSFNFAFGGKHGDLRWRAIDFALVMYSIKWETSQAGDAHPIPCTSAFIHFTKRTKRTISVLVGQLALVP